MNPLLLPLSIAAMFGLALLSVPWLIVGIGFAGLGDDSRADRVMDAAPLGIYLDWVEGRRA